MEEITFSKGTIAYRDYTYTFEQTEKIDDLCVHVFMGGQVVALLGNNTIINGIAMATADDIINSLNNG
jgi:hypothetical protein